MHLVHYRLSEFLKVDFLNFDNSVNFLFLLSSDFQNYLRTQTGSTTTINVIICTVDYLLRLQVSQIYSTYPDFGKTED